jgi:macrocin-O-methyltransferase TylF-like protien
LKDLKTESEREVGPNVARIFSECADSVEVKLQNFPKYVRRQHLKRFLAMYELFKLAMPVKGSIVECGVFRGFGVMTWAKLSAMLEPENLTRRIYGFDTFDGFPTIGNRDRSKYADPAVGELASSSYDELTQLLAEYDRDRFLGHISKVELVKGDMVSSVPAFIETHPHIVVSLLFIDCDLYDPTNAALKAFLPRMPKGAVIAFDELDNPIWPGETLAALDGGVVRDMKLRRFDWDPYIAYAVIE